MLKTDIELFEYVKANLFVAVVCDVLDNIGYRNQAMHPRLRPLISDMKNCRFIGRARTFQWMEVNYTDKNDPYGLEIEGMDSLCSNDVVVHSNCVDCAIWGELMTTVAMNNYAVGCVCDNMIRDCVKIKKMNFPVFARGICPLDSKGRGKVTNYDVTIKCGDIIVNPGDIIFADYDGIIVVPKSISYEVFEMAKEKVEKESLSRRDLLNGNSLREAYNRYRVL